jgi:tetraacyldisaccharide 4'-kinase
VPLEEPVWWYDQPLHIAGRALQPIAWMYGALARRRMLSPACYRPPIPVICIGNFTAGGTGKTPLAIALAGLLRHDGRRPAFLSRGYGGQLRGPHLVDTARDTAAEVGDEPLLLARHGPVLISRDRSAGARAIVARNLGDCIIMDDGLQNPALAKDLTIAVVDGARGLGNARVIPAGPLRAPLHAQLRLVDLIVINGRPQPGVLQPLSGSRVPILNASVVATGDPAWLQAKPLMAFAGIGNPGRFYRTLADLGGEVVETRSFPDHHAFSEADARALLDAAARAGAQLVTTEKDYVRLTQDEAGLASLRAACRVLPVTMAFDGAGEDRLAAMLAGLNWP